MNTIVNKLGRDQHRTRVATELCHQGESQAFQHAPIAIAIASVGLAFSANEPQSNFIPHAKFPKHEPDSCPRAALDYSWLAPGLSPWLNDS